MLFLRSGLFVGYLSALASFVRGSSSVCSSISAKYHDNAACDVVGYNQFKHGQGLARHFKYRALKDSGAHQKVPESKTIFCPEQETNILLRSPDSVDGFDTAWIVENDASRPVVVAWVDNDGTEYSAADPTIAPAWSDPEAILMPGAWRAMRTYEGHVFHVRELLDDGSAGDLLLQHRVGLVTVGSRRQDLPCPDAASGVPKKSRDRSFCQRTDPEPEDGNYARTVQSLEHRHCNTIDIGFRNAANCPLHGYWTHPADSPIPSLVAGNETATCKEDFRFHLGKDPGPKDFMWDWNSPTKYESSFIGSTFTFRLAANPAILIETYTLEPTRVRDCPQRETTAYVAVYADGQVLPVGRRVDTSPDPTRSGNETTTLATITRNLTDPMNNHLYYVSPEIDSLY